jgi:uncharacterized protein YecE (DUF72 family)
VSRTRSGAHSPSPGLHLGTSGYRYDDWRGRFYPEDLPESEWLGFYAERFTTVEINNTFYGLPGPETFDRWRDQVPTGFVFTLKYSRYGSHLKHLKDPDDHLLTFLDRARRLGDRLGPILVQLPPRWKANPDRLAAFLDAADEAASEQRWAIELRDASWLIGEVFAVVEDHGAALVVHDLLEDHPERRTAEWIYRRYHGDHYQGSYSPQKLTVEAKKIRQHLDEGRPAYVYFNNTAAGCAIADAEALGRYLG